MAVGLLLASLGAVGKTAREKSKQTLCLGNLKVLTKAWLSFAENNRGRIIGGMPSNSDPDAWVKRPYTISLPDQKEAIRQGALYPYVKNLNAYHCPGDRERIASDGTVRHGWGSYNIAGTLNGDGWPQCCAKKQIYKISAIQSPESKYVFVEEADWRGWNVGSWGVHTRECPSTSDYFGDRLAVWHFDYKCNFGWVDGHVSTKTWEEWSDEAPPYPHQYPCQRKKGSQKFSAIPLILLENISSYISIGYGQFVYQHPIKKMTFFISTTFLVDILLFM